MSANPPSVAPSRGYWSSRLNFILATTGAAVGLGNIWKFPYMAGDNGGSAFVLVYLICVALIGLPIMLSEMLIGRYGQQNVVNSLAVLATQVKASPRWQWLGWWGAITLVLILSFYSVVAGWSLAYLFKALNNAFANATPAHIATLWNNFLASPWDLLKWHALFMFLVLWVVGRGLQQGIELAARIMMPLLLITLIVLDGYATSMPGFNAAFQFLFSFHLDKLTPSVIISALGHAFFTLAIGAGCMLTYGSYLQSHIRLGSAVVTIAALDVLVALLAGLAIFPLIFTYQLQPQAGPGLMFKVLPVAFAHMGGGQVLGSLFFLLLLFAAWASSLSMAEPLVALLVERYRYKRTQAAFIVGLAAWILGIGSALSFNVWQNYELFHHWSIFTAITDTVTNIMLPIGGLMFALFAGWIIPKSLAHRELDFKPRYLLTVWSFLTRYIAPLGIIIILISAVL